MRKNHVAILSGVVALALVATLSGVLCPKNSLAGGSACSDASKAGGASKASASAGANCCADKAGMKVEKAGMDGAHCTLSTSGTHASDAHGAGCCPFDRASCEKQAPGTKYDFQTSKAGATLTITAASAQYVSAVQTFAASRFETMKAQLASQKSVKTSAGSSCCLGDKAAMKAEKSGASCPAGASMTSASGFCPEVGAGLCGAECAFQKTATGARITWSSTKPEVVKSVQMATNHMKTCMAGTGL